MFCLSVGELLNAGVCSAIILLCGRLCSRLNQWSHQYSTERLHMWSYCHEWTEQCTWTFPYYQSVQNKVSWWDLPDWRAGMARKTGTATAWKKLRNEQNWTEQNIRNLILRVGTSLSIAALYYILFCDWLWCTGVIVLFAVPLQRLQSESPFQCSAALPVLESERVLPFYIYFRQITSKS